LNEVGTRTHDREALEVGVQYVVFRANPWKDRERQLARRRRTVHPALDARKWCDRTPVMALGVSLQDWRVPDYVLINSTSSNAVHLTLCIETSLHRCLLVPDTTVHIDLLKRDHFTSILEDKSAMAPVMSTACWDITNALAAGVLGEKSP